jgi:hypothetical protein
MPAKGREMRRGGDGVGFGASRVRETRDDATRMVTAMVAGAPEATVVARRQRHL